MANSNFVVHNGLTVGPTTIDAASGNVVIPVGKQILIGNVILRDNGDGKLAVRDKTDNSDVVIVATVSATSSTQGNIQIGTNHIESINANGPISIRPNGTGQLWFSSNTIDIGRGGATTISTGGGAGYTGGNLILAPAPGHFVVVSGNLNVTGTQTIFSTNNSSFTDGMVYYADGNASDILDLGFVTAWTNASYQHGGFVRDASDGIWKLFGNVASEPTTTINFTNAIYQSLQVGNLRVKDSVTAITNYGTNGVGNIGASGAGFNTIFAKSTSAQYADLAENYQADSAYEPGTVVHFGGEYEVTLCDADMCSRVAGVVSTAPAHLMNTGLIGDHVVALALAGRVPTKVQGTVRKGDMMVSAGNGRARADYSPIVGSVIGKALEDFDGAEGVIEVVVGIR